MDTMSVQQTRPYRVCQTHVVSIYVCSEGERGENNRMSRTDEGQTNNSPVRYLMTEPQACFQELLKTAHPNTKLCIADIRTVL